MLERDFWSFEILALATNDTSIAFHLCKSAR